MAPPRDSAPQEDLTGIVVGLVFFVILQAGAIATYAFLLFDIRYTCDRARDSCEVVHVRPPFWHEVTGQFRPSQLVKASWVSGRKGSGWVELTMADGAPEIRLEGKSSQELVALLNAFVANPAQPRFQHVVEPYVAQYIFGGLVQILAFIILSAAAYEVIKRQRAG